MDTKRKPGETETQYVWRICSAKDTGALEMNWEEVADILNKELRDEGEYYTSSAYRKKYQQAKIFKDEVFSKETDTEAEQRYLEQKRELERLKVQYRDERRGFNTQNYVTARFDRQMEELAEQLQTIGRKEFLVFDSVDRESTKDMIVCLNDTHFGLEFDNSFGQYNPDIAAERLETYLDKIVEIGEINNIESVYVACLGDTLSGLIHPTIQIANRENIIEQIKTSAEFIANFCTELAGRFKHVYVYGCSGNHSRVQPSKELNLKNDKFDDLIMYIVDCLLKHIGNITVHLDNIDTTIAEMDIRGKEYVLVHGDMDKWTPNDIAKLSLMLHKIPYCVINGHKHFPASSEISGVKCIQSGSLCGSGDDFTITQRLYGNPNQTVLTVDEYGIDGIFNIDLS